MTDKDVREMLERLEKYLSEYLAASLRDRHEIENANLHISNDSDEGWCVELSGVYLVKSQGYTEPILLEHSSCQSSLIDAIITCHLEVIELKRLAEEEFGS